MSHVDRNKKRSRGDDVRLGNIITADGDTLRALSIRQPWAWAITHAGKRIENRSWSTNYRGPILIHAGAAFPEHEYEDAVHFMVDIGAVDTLHRAGGTVGKPLIPWRSSKDFLLGGFVARARIAGVVESAADLSQYFSDPAELVMQRSWYTGACGIVLADVEPIPLVPWKGALGIFNVPRATFERLSAEAATT